MKDVKEILLKAPAMILYTILSIFISMSTAGAVMLYMLAQGVNKHLTLFTSLAVAIVVYTFIVFNHKIRDYIKGN